MSDLFTGLKQSLREKNQKSIVFPEATDERILVAASRLAQEELVKPILIGKEEHILELAQNLNADISNCEILDPDNYTEFDDMVDAFVERRNGRVSKEDAQNVLKDENYF